MPQEIPPLLSAAHAERSRDKCRNLLEKAIALCENWERSGGGLEAVLLKARTIGELALEEDRPETRASRWNECLNILASRWCREAASPLAHTYAHLAVDCSQDLLSSNSDEERTKILRRARDYLDEAIKEERSLEVTAELLSRKSSVLREMAIYAFSNQGRMNLIGESQRCAKRAVSQVRTAATVLELGLSEWALAQLEPTDERYANRLRKAEAFFCDELLTEYELATLTLSRLYRMTFRPWDACLTFSRVLRHTVNVRRILRDSYIYGESAVQLWYADYPETEIKRHLSEARTLLEAAVCAGYNTARNIVTLSFVIAILDGSAAGGVALTDIYTSDREISWFDVCRLLAEHASENESTSDELITEGFALGIDQSAVWTRLGTFAWRFLENDDLAEALYKAAVRVNPHDAIAHTNYARFLIGRADAPSLQRAERELQKAQALADRRFTWWRAVYADLHRVRAGRSQTKERQTRQLERLNKPPAYFWSMDQIKARFRSATILSNAQQRGYELEQLVFETAKLTFGTAAPPYRIRRTEGAISQIDGYFEHRGEKYRVECKWLTEQADHNDIITFADKLETVGISGLFVSMAGFTSSAVQRAKEFRSTKAILLMDGQEAQAVFNACMTFDELMTIKRLHFDQFSDPYYHIVPAVEVA